MSTEAATRFARARPRSILAVAALGAWLNGCAAAPRSQPSRPTTPASQPASRPTASGGSIAIECDQSAATVTLDGKPVGNVAAIAAKGGLHVPPGVYRLELRHVGFRPFRIELRIDHQREQLTVRLEKLPSP